MTVMLRAAVVILIGGASLAGPGAATAPTQVRIVGNDYAFTQVPSSLPAGEAVFAFENRGKVRHELSIALLKRERGAADILDAFKQGNRRRELYETSIGVLLAFPGDTAGGRLLATLLPGRTYALICSLRDTPDAQQHVLMGMYAVFTVPEH